MRYILSLLLMSVMLLARAGKLDQANSLAIYEGKYQMTVRNMTGYIVIATKNKQLTLIETWTHNEYKLKQLNGDNFIMDLRGWAVKFNRDTKGKVVSVVVMGRDVWTRVK